MATSYLKINALLIVLINIMEEHLIEHAKDVMELVENVLVISMINVQIVKIIISNKLYFFKINNVKDGKNVILEHMETLQVIYV
mgnify:CR=1 FL=1